jgi:hypothetical protein
VTLEAYSRRATAVVPARNEAATIAAVVSSLLSIEGVDEVVVVANGCGDETANLAAAAGARVLVSTVGRGKGGALEEGLALAPPADFYLLVDGDVGDTAAGAAALLEEVLAGRLDLAIGVLPGQTGAGLGLVRRFAAWCIERLTGFRSEAPLSGQRAITRAALGGCRPLASGFGVETAMTIDALRLGHRVGELPVDMTHRPTGRGPAGFVHRGLQGLDIARAVAWRALLLR